MGKLKKIKKFKAPEINGKTKDVIISKTMTVLVVFLFLIFAAMLVKAFLRQSDYFKLRAVDIKASFLDPRAASSISSRVFNAYRSKNVFNINLKYIAQSIQSSYGDVRDVVASISLPDKLVISLKLRRPVALIKSGKFYPVDEDGVILPGGSRVEALNDLPVINGLDIRTINSGLTGKNLNLTLELLGEIRRARSLSSFGVSSISVYDPRNMSFCLKNGVEIRIGQENFRERLNLLSKALRDPRLALDNIRYIDVRFKDIVVGPK
ncbi:MAG: cell division protein FtsQ/DivIB [Candidatus Omnitrophica bacterium]|nr:cell division protein FtsQ/DivIB [Candidatus Omnitrophota bacterium]